MRKLAVLFAITLMATPTLSHAAMNGANTVNSAAIVDGSIATADLANKAVTAAKIADATITATQLAAGAVTDAKITGPISVSKLPVGTTSTTVAAGNHTHKYANVITVAKTGGDYTSPAAALAAITNASATNPYLVKVMPGVYDLGTASLQMKPFVELEGSGQDSTVISGSSANIVNETCTAGTVVMSNNSTLRNIRIVSTSPSAGAPANFAAVVFNNAKAKAEDVSIAVTANAGFNGIGIGVCTVGLNGHAILKDTTVAVDSRSTAGTAPITLYDDGSVTLSNSTITSYSSGGSNLVDCSTGAGSGTLTILDSYLTGVVSQSSGSYNMGLWLGHCKAIIANTIVRLEGGTGATGIENAKCSSSIANSQFYVSPNNGVIPVGVNLGGNDGSSIVRISNSIIQGVIMPSSALKLFNNCDENLVPIPNQ